MKYRILPLVILMTYLVGTHGVSAMNRSSFQFSPDTIPENFDLLIDRTDTISNDLEFDDLESDLNELEGKSKDDSDTTRIRIGNMKVAIINDGSNVYIDRDDWDDDSWDEDWSDHHKSDNFRVYSKNKKFKPHWAGVSLGLNNFVTSEFSTSLPADQELLALNTNNSMEFNLNIAQIGFPIIAEHFGIVTGVGFKWNNYKFRNSNTILVSDSTPLYYFESPEKEFKFSKLTTCYLVVPLLLEFQVKTHNKPLYLSVGVEGGLKLGAWAKMKSKDGGKYKNKSDFHTPTWDYRATTRIGYGAFGLFSTLGLNPVFEKNKGPEVYPFTVGASLNF